MNRDELRRLEQRVLGRIGVDRGSPADQASNRTWLKTRPFSFSELRPSADASSSTVTGGVAPVRLSAVETALEPSNRSE